MDGEEGEEREEDKCTVEVGGSRRQVKVQGWPLKESRERTTDHWPRSSVVTTTITTAMLSLSLRTPFSVPLG